MVNCSVISRMTDSAAVRSGMDRQSAASRPASDRQEGRRGGGGAYPRLDGAQPAQQLGDVVEAGPFGVGPGRRLDQVEGDRRVAGVEW